MNICDEYECSPQEDAQKIQNAIKGIRNDEKELIQIISKRSNHHLQKVKEEYQRLFETDLEKKLESEVDQKIKDIVKALFTETTRFQGDLIFDSVDNEMDFQRNLILFIAGKDEDQREKTQKYLREERGVELVGLVQQKCHKMFQKMLVNLVERKRSQGIEEDKLHDEVKELGKPNEDRWHNDIILDLFTLRSHEHICKVGRIYHHYFKNSLEDLIRQETIHGPFQDLLHAFLDSPALFWAKQTHVALRQFCADESLLVRCFVQGERSFLREMGDEYLLQFGVPLPEDVRKYTSGNYCDLLLNLLDVNENVGKFEHN